MKRIVTMSICLFIASSAMAVLTQPIADVATSQQGQLGLSGGFSIESDVTLYGVRGSYGLMDGISVFGGLGLVEINDLDSEVYVQGGGTYQLPVDLPVDLALRGGLGFMSADDYDIMTVNGGALASMAIQEALTIYVFGGLSYSKIEIDYGEWGDDSETETDLALAGGAIFAVTPNMAIYGELAMIDELFISGGLKMTL